MNPRRTETVTVNVAIKLRALRARSGLKVKEVAKALGYASPAGYHRWENEAKMADKKYIPVEMAEKLWEVYRGKGNPPITREEVMALAGQPIPTQESLESILNELSPQQRDEVLVALKLLLSNLKGGGRVSCLLLAGATIATNFPWDMVTT